MSRALAVAAGAVVGLLAGAAYTLRRLGRGAPAADDYAVPAGWRPRAD